MTDERSYEKKWGFLFVGISLLLSWPMYIVSGFLMGDQGHIFGVIAVWLIFFPSMIMCLLADFSALKRAVIVGILRISCNLILAWLSYALFVEVALKDDGGYRITFNGMIIFFFGLSLYELWKLVKLVRSKEAF